jgi:hypothetical protein
MFCGNAPCTCNAKAKTETKPRVPRQPRKPTGPKPAVEDLPDNSGSSKPQKAVVGSIHDAMRQAAQKKHVEPPKTERQQQDADQAEIDELIADPEFASAIRAFEPLLGREDRIKYKGLLNEPPSAAERAVTWRKRRDENVSQVL